LPADPDTQELFELMLGEFRLWIGRGPPVISDAELKRLTAPTCLMTGQYEITLDPYKVIERGLRVLPNVISAEIVPGVGHMMERPDRIIPRAISFLEMYAA
jgi:pimeloyl-ACP methyl ester carboxylesterase